MSNTAPKRVGDWWICHRCGEAGRGALLGICACHETDWTPLTLTEDDWLKCRNPHALLAMVDLFRKPPAIALSPAPSGIAEAWVRCTLGNPFRPVTLDPDWLTWHNGTVGMLARACGSCRECEKARIWPLHRCEAEDLDQSRFPILADALEESGCTIDHVLRHLREPSAHWPHCHVLRAILD